MRPDIPFWSWVIARRLPIFALVATLISVIGATLISRQTQSYTSIAELLIDPNAAQHRSIDDQSHFEFLKFKSLTSGEVERVVSELALPGNPISRASVYHDEHNGKVTIGFHDPSPETALLMTTAITRALQVTAKNLAKQDAQRRLSFHETEARALRAELESVPSPSASNEGNPKGNLTEELYQIAVNKLAKAKADIETPIPEIMSMLRQPTLAKTPSGPDKSSMYFALFSFAIFCGLIMILILEWLDTVIRRPHDIEYTLGLATFGVIPDLQLQPIEAKPNSKRGL